MTLYLYCLQHNPERYLSGAIRGSLPICVLSTRVCAGASGASGAGAGARAGVPGARGESSTTSDVSEGYSCVRVSESSNCSFSWNTRVNDEVSLSRLVRRTCVRARCVCSVRVCVYLGLAVRVGARGHRGPPVDEHVVVDEAHAQRRHRRAPVRLAAPLLPVGVVLVVRRLARAPQHHHARLARLQPTHYTL